MSVITSSKRQSILKDYVATNRDLSKSVNRVTFALFRDKNLRSILRDPTIAENKRSYDEYLTLVKDDEISERDFLNVIQECRECICLLKPKFSLFVEALLSMNWFVRSDTVVLEYQKFLIDLLSAHNKYTQFAVNSLVKLWLPLDNDQLEWKLGVPSERKQNLLQYVHETINVIMDVIPLAQYSVMYSIRCKFPYQTRSPFVIAGFVYNLFWFSKYRSALNDEIFYLLLKELIVIDVNCPRSQIDEAECNDNAFDDDQEMFPMDKIQDDMDESTMKDPKAEALDLCLEQFFNFIDRYHKENEQNLNKKTIHHDNLHQWLMKQFENIILPTHNSHHVQFIYFYYCSLKPIIAHSFLKICWQKASDPNVPTLVRQTAVGYIASMVSRAEYIELPLIKNILKDLCEWAHKYVQRCDLGQNINSIRAHAVFYAVCQAVFYIISFRSRSLTKNSKDLIFLQSLQLSSLLTSNLNPLHVCIPAVATAFAGVTRAHQLAYCHTILERNARKKLATVYSNDTAMPEDTLDTFFPFDQYLLKKSGTRIEPIYREYQASDAEEHTPSTSSCNNDADVPKRRRHISSCRTDDIDDFIVDKKFKISELSKSFDRDMQFNFGTTSG